MAFFQSFFDDKVRVEQQHPKFGGKFRVYKMVPNEAIPNMPPHPDGGRFQIISEHDEVQAAVSAATKLGD